MSGAILSLRTDKPEAEIGLHDHTGAVLAQETWQAHRQLAETIHTKIMGLLQKQQLDWHDIMGVVVFQGPGSFTGLRIGLSVANSLAYSLNAPIVASGGEAWAQDGIKRLRANQNDRLALPEYGAAPNITTPKK